MSNELKIDPFAVQKHPQMPSLTKDNVLGLLNASIARRGGHDQTYAKYAAEVLDKIKAPAELRDHVITAHKCYYTVPEFVIREDHDESDYRIVTERKFIPRDSERKPLCLIGCVIVDLGVPIHAFDRTPTCLVNACQAITLLKQLSETGFLSYDRVAGEVLSAAQGAQDAKETWGRAFQAGVDTHTLHIRNTHLIAPSF